MSMPQEKKRSTNIQVVMKYKKKLDRATSRASEALDERVPMTKILYKLIDDHLEEATDNYIKENEDFC